MKSWPGASRCPLNSPDADALVGWFFCRRIDEAVTSLPFVCWPGELHSPDLKRQKMKTVFRSGGVGPGAVETTKKLQTLALPKQPERWSRGPKSVPSPRFITGGGMQGLEFVFLRPAILVSTTGSSLSGPGTMYSPFSPTRPWERMVFLIETETTPSAKKNRFGLTIEKRHHSWSACVHTGSRPRTR